MTQSTEHTELAATVSIGGDLTVGRIGYGAMQLTGPKVWGAYPDHDKGIAVLQEVVRAGVTFLARTPTRNSSGRRCTRIRTTW